MFVDGTPVTVPSGIVIKIDDPHVRRFEDPDGSMSYGGIDFCDEACISPLHTHDWSGIIHTESAEPRPEYVWLSFSRSGASSSARPASRSTATPTPIAVYIGGEPYVGDPRAIELTDKKVIVVVVGTPPAVIPSTADFSAA